MVGVFVVDTIILWQRSFDDSCLDLRTHHVFSYIYGVVVAMKNSGDSFYPLSVSYNKAQYNKEREKEKSSMRRSRVSANRAAGVICLTRLPRQVRAELRAARARVPRSELAPRAARPGPEEDPPKPCPRRPSQLVIRPIRAGPSARGGRGYESRRSRD